MLRGFLQLPQVCTQLKKNKLTKPNQTKLPVGAVPEFLGESPSGRRFFSARGRGGSGSLPFMQSASHFETQSGVQPISTLLCKHTRSCVKLLSYKSCSPLFVRVCTYTRVCVCVCVCVCVSVCVYAARTSTHPHTAAARRRMEPPGARPATQVWDATPATRRGCRNSLLELISAFFCTNNRCQMPPPRVAAATSRA